MELLIPKHLHSLDVLIPLPLVRLSVGWVCWCVAAVLLQALVRLEWSGRCLKQAGIKDIDGFAYRYDKDKALREALFLEW